MLIIVLGRSDIAQHHEDNDKPYSVKGANSQVGMRWDLGPPDIDRDTTESTSRPSVAERIDIISLHKRHGGKKSEKYRGFPQSGIPALCLSISIRGTKTTAR